MTFSDPGAPAWYVKSAPWFIEGFTIPGFRSELEELHARIQTSGPIRIRQGRFWLRARKPRAG